MKRDAAWLLRRYRDQAAPDWRVRQVLEQKFAHIIEDYSSLQSDMDELRRSAQDRLHSFDATTDRALQLMGERRFALALKEMQTAENELAELHRSLGVATDLRKTVELLASVDELVPPVLRAQPTLEVLRRLRDLARSLLDESETRKARFVVLLLRSQLDRLRARSREDSNTHLERSLHHMEGQGGEALAQLRRLAHEGYHYLAEMLVDDLEVDLAVKDRTRRASVAPGEAFNVAMRDYEEIRKRAEVMRESLTQWLNSIA